MSIYQALKDRGVIRVAVAYLAGAWLVAQVLEVLTSLLDLAPEIARYVLFVIAIGFPVALLLSWRYDLTAQGVVVADGTSDHARPGTRRLDVAIIVTLSAAVVLLVVDNYVIRSGVRSNTLATPVVSNVTQLTQSQLFFPPVTSQYPMVSDGARIYFSQWTADGLGLAQIPIGGGAHSPLTIPFDDPELEARVTDVSPDKSDLLLNTWKPGDTYATSWLWPTTGAAPRKQADVADAAFSKDGTQVVYSPDRREIVVADADFSNPRTIGKATGFTHWLRMSPDGKTVRFVVVGRVNKIFEMPVDGGEASPLLPDWQEVDHCCGTWTDDGRYYVFQASIDGRTQLWAIREDVPTGEPVQITSGALDFRRPMLTNNGREIYAIGWQLRGELVKYDPDVGRFLPLPGLESLSAEWVAYSQDGASIAYVSHPDGTLWRSNSDGTRKIQLTSPPLIAIGPQWSPDGQSIAFTGVRPGEPYRAYRISSDGGVPEVLDPDDRPSFSVYWSRDGGSLAYRAAGADLIQILDLATGDVSGIEGTEGLFVPKWSPDGGTLAARNRKGLVLFHPSSGEVQPLLDVENLDDHFWSDDGQALYFAESVFEARKRGYFRLDLATGAVTEIAIPGDVQAPWGVFGVWVGAAPDGMPMMLRDLGIHHIYKLDWLPEASFQ